MEVLAALDSLDKKEKLSKGGTNRKIGNPRKDSSIPRTRPKDITSQTVYSLESRNQTRPPTSNTRPPTSQTRPTTSQSTATTNTRPPSNTGFSHNSESPSASHLSVNNHERSNSVTSTVRRISFVEPPPPPSTRRRLRLTTKGNSILNGFEYDPTLATKYHVGEDEWTHFSDAIIKEAHIPRRARYVWFFHKNNIIKRIKRDLQYNGDISSCISAWNRMDFRKKGFEVSLELPGPPKFRSDMSEEEKAIIKKQAPFFRLVLTPTTEKGQSIYIHSRSNSITANNTTETKAENAQAKSTNDEVASKETEINKPNAPLNHARET